MRIHADSNPKHWIFTKHAAKMWYYPYVTPMHNDQSHEITVRNAASFVMNVLENTIPGK
jgi:hypothetical protein